MELQAEKNIDGMQNGIQTIQAFHQNSYLTQLVNQIFIITFCARVFIHQRIQILSL